VSPQNSKTLMGDLGHANRSHGFPVPQQISKVYMDSGEGLEVEVRVPTAYLIKAVLKLTLFSLSQQLVFSFVLPIEKKEIM
jgi:hypothetical protein